MTDARSEDVALALLNERDHGMFLVKNAERLEQIGRAAKKTLARVAELVEAGIL